MNLNLNPYLIGRSPALPCPWCGRAPWIEVGGPKLARVFCRYSGCPVKPHAIRTTPKRAIAAWNMRPNP